MLPGLTSRMPLHHVSLNCTEPSVWSLMDANMADFADLTEFYPKPMIESSDSTGLVKMLKSHLPRTIRRSNTATEVGAAQLLNAHGRYRANFRRVATSFCSQERTAKNRVFFSTSVLPSRMQSLGTPYSSMAQTECQNLACNLYNPLELFDCSSRPLKDLD
jgi:hypothetical protein